MKVLIVGASGLIGSHLYRIFAGSEESIGTYFSLKTKELVQLDIRDKRQLSDFFGNYTPDVIIHPAAVSNVDYCEEHPEETRQVNIEGTKNLIEYAKLLGSKFVYFSSDYIFDGENGPYSEEDIPCPINEYGRQKVEVENFIKKSLDDYLVIRTTVVYGWEEQGKNFVMGIIKRLKNGETIRVPTDQVGSPTYARNLVGAVKELIKKNKEGICNIVGSQILDRYRFSQVVCRVFSLDSSRLIPVFTEQLGQKARRPPKAGLKIDKAKKELKTRLVGVEEGLRMMKDEKKICQV